MSVTGRAGRPKASSRETLAEAACELFLERGYESTSIADITQRAGVSRSSFFNYFTSKSDVLWSGVDERIELAAAALDAQDSLSDADAVVVALRAIVHDFAPDPLALAYRNRRAMGLGDELVRDAATRHARIAEPIARAALRSGIGIVRADVIGAAYGAVLMTSLRIWAEQGAGLNGPDAVLEEALQSVDDVRWG